MEKIGISVNKVSTQVCVLTEDREYEESRIRTDRDALTVERGMRPGSQLMLARAQEPSCAQIA